MKKLIITIAVVALLVTACTRKTNGLYLQAVQVAVDNYNLVVDDLDARIEAYDNDPQLIHDPTWAAESLQILVDLQTAGNAFRTLPDATSDLDHLNSLLQSVANETDLYVDAMTTAINNLDINGVESARAHRETIGQYMDDAQNELIQFLASH